MATRDRRDQVLFSLSQLVTVSGDPPVILVDNGSADGTPEAVERAFPNVTVLRAGRNLGAAGRTLGVRAARTPLVAFSDDDSWWGEGALDRAAGHFARCPRLALLAARMLIGPEGLEDPVCREMRDSPLPRRSDLPGASILGFVACGAVVSKQAYLDAGGFSPVVFFLGEEDVLAQDLAAAGWGLAYVDDVVAHHWPQPGSDRAGRRRLQARNALLSSWLRRPLPTALRDSLRLASQARDPQLLGALIDAALRLPAALAARRVLPPSVEADLRLLRAEPRCDPPQVRPARSRA
jgi:GT2 family glycosyltransferase